MNQSKPLEQRYQEVHDKVLASPGKDLQLSIDSGRAWKTGAKTKRAMEALAEGSAVLPGYQSQDYYGGPIPGYNDVENEVGSTGSVANAEAYYEKEAH